MEYKTKYMLVDETGKENKLTNIEATVMLQIAGKQSERK